MSTDKPPRELYSALRYQLAPVSVTTMGPCAKGCGHSARGSATCGWCLTAELEAAGYADAKMLYWALATSQQQILAAEEWVYLQERGDGL